MIEDNYTYRVRPRTESVLQTNFERDFHTNYYNLNAEWIGPDDLMLLSGQTYSEGATFYDGTLSGRITSSKTTKLEDDRTRFSLTVKVNRGNGSSGGEDDPDLLDVTWSESMSQYSFPLYRYCAPSALNGDPDYGNAAILKSWENEDNPTLKKDFKTVLKYYDDNGEVLSTIVTELSGRTRDIAEKMAAGVEEVIRYYPTCTRVSTFDKYRQNASMQDRTFKINHIDYTPFELFDWDISWLKTQYDWDQQQDGTWKLTESWQGVQGNLSEADISATWDRNLYGSGNERWRFYYPSYWHTNED